MLLTDEMNELKKLSEVLVVLLRWKQTVRSEVYYTGSIWDSKYRVFLGAIPIFKSLRIIVSIVPRLVLLPQFDIFQCLNPGPV